MKKNQLMAPDVKNAFEKLMNAFLGNQMSPSATGFTAFISVFPDDD
jgi:hypothetical protein